MRNVNAPPLYERPPMPRPLKKMTDTPRTDRAVIRNAFHVAELCRSLERELVETRKDAERWREYCRTNKPGFIEQLTILIDTTIRNK